MIRFATEKKWSNKKPHQYELLRATYMREIFPRQGPKNVVHHEKSKIAWKEFSTVSAQNMLAMNENEDWNLFVLKAARTLTLKGINVESTPSPINIMSSAVKRNLLFLRNRSGLDTL